MKQKKCFKCNEVKPLSEFYKHSQMADGHVNKCKQCNKADVRDNYRKNIDHYKSYERKRAMAPHRVEARKAYESTEAGKAALRKARDRWINKNTIKRAAQIMVGNAVRDGKLIKPDSCSECGAGGRIHGHHDDYAQPLSVRWLCPACHTKWHKKNEPKNG